MDVTQVFNELITKVEKSNLNYIIHNKTPFSAQISIKRSFVNFFDAPAPVVKNLPSCVVKEEKSELIKVTKALEIAKAKIDNLEDSVEKEMEKVKSLQSEISNYREEVLEIKREKKDLKSKLVQHESQIIDFQKDQTKLRQDNAKFEKLLKEKSEVLNVRSSDLTNLHKEKGKVDKELKESLAELEIFKQTFSEPIKKVETVYTCPFCEDKFKCKIELSQHVRIKHVRDQVSQTEIQKIQKSDISDYPCFYCDEEIKSYETLLKHRTECPEIGVFEEEYASPHDIDNTEFGYQDTFPCDECEAQCVSLQDWGRHKKTYHPDPEVTTLWCDICPLYFEKDIDLKFHKRGCHWDQM